VLQAHIVATGRFLPSLNGFTWLGRASSRSHEMKSPARTMSHKAPRPKRAASYARRPSKRPQLSLARQIAVIRKYAKRHRLEIVRAYSDVGKGGGKA